MENRSAVFQYRSDCCTIEIHNVIKGNTSPFQENNEIQALICFLNAIYNVSVPFQVTGYRKNNLFKIIILCTRHVKTFITSFTSLCLFIVNSFTLQDTHFLDKLLNHGLRLSTHNSLISNNSMQTSLTAVFLPLFHSLAATELSEFMFSLHSFSLTDVTITLNLS